MLTEIFWSFVITSSAGLIIAVARMFYKSKCKTIQLCCLKVERDVITENNTDLVVNLARRLSGVDEKKDDEPLDATLRYENIYHKTLPKKLCQLPATLKTLDTLESGDLMNVGLGGS